MFVSFFTGYLLLFLLGALSAVFCFWLLRKKLKNPLSISLAGALLFLLMIPYLARLAFVYTVLELGNGEIINEQMVFGSGMYTASDGQRVSVTENPASIDDHCFIINAGDRDLIYEYLVYGKEVQPGIAPGSTSLTWAPHSFHAMQEAPDYLPWETPDREVYTRSSTEYRTWLRYKTEADEPAPLFP